MGFYGFGNTYKKKNSHMKQGNVLYVWLCILCFTTVNAQNNFFVTAPNNRFSIGTEKNKTASISLGDIDQDGDLDVVVANGRHWPQQNFMLFNSGDRKFNVMIPVGLARSTTYAAELGDLDGDGDLDLVTGNDVAPNRLFLNEGNGQFREFGSFGNDNFPTRNITLGDIDSDGDLDVLITNRGTENEICLNSGNAEFDQTISFGSSDDSTIDVEIEDIDQDGDADLILANRDQQQNYIYLNDQLSFSERIPFGTGKEDPVSRCG